MTFSSYQEHTKPLFNNYKILNIFQINDFLIGQFMFKYHQNSLPKTFDSYFILTKNIHSYNTRNCLNIYQAHSKTNYGIHSVNVKEPNYGMNYLKTWKTHKIHSESSNKYLKKS